MDVSTATQPGVLLDHRTVEAQLGFLNSADLSLRTREGDLVNLSFANNSNFAGTYSETTDAEGGVTQEISTVAQAASRYSLAVEGNLNTDELAAIQALATGIEPIARDFFLNGGFDFNAATATLTASLDQVQEVKLSLERVVSATLGFQQTQTQDPAPPPAEAPQLPAHGTDAATLLNPNPQPHSLNFPRIRDINELVKAVVDTEFPARAVEILGSKTIVRSLREFMDFIKQRLAALFSESPQAPDSPPVSDGPAPADPAAQPTDIQAFAGI